MLTGPWHDELVSYFVVNLLGALIRNDQAFVHPFPSRYSPRRGEEREGKLESGRVPIESRSPTRNSRRDGAATLHTLLGWSFHRKFSGGRHSSSPSTTKRQKKVLVGEHGVIAPSAI